MATAQPKQPKQPKLLAGRRRTAGVRKPSATPRKRSTSEGAQTSTTSRASNRQAHQIAVLVAAIVCGLIGLAVHVFVLASIVLMSILLGLIAAGARSGRDKSVIAELTAEAKSAMGDLTGRG